VVALCGAGVFHVRRSISLTSTDIGARLGPVVRALRFFRAWMRSPIRTGAIVPSGQDLAGKIVQEVRPHQGRVIELGGGTGAFTRALLELGVLTEDLEVVEINPELARGLRKQFPGVRVIQANATELVRSVSGKPGEYQAIISGLPMLAIPKAVQRSILAASFTLLAEEGALYQFTYSNRSPIDQDILDEFGLNHAQIATSWRNFPPARVFRFTQRRQN